MTVAVPRLRALRLARAMTMRELAARSGVSLSAIAELERGKRQAQPSTIGRLANALDVQPTDILRRSYPEDGAPAVASGETPFPIEVPDDPEIDREAFWRLIAHIPRTREAIAANLAAMDADTERSAEMARLDAE